MPMLIVHVPESFLTPSRQRWFCETWEVPKGLHTSKSSMYRIRLNLSTSAFFLESEIHHGMTCIVMHIQYFFEWLGLSSIFFKTCNKDWSTGTYWNVLLSLLFSMNSTGSTTEKCAFMNSLLLYAVGKGPSFPKAKPTGFDSDRFLTKSEITVIQITVDIDNWVEITFQL